MAPAGQFGSLIVSRPRRRTRTRTRKIELMKPVAQRIEDEYEDEHEDDIPEGCVSSAQYFIA